jgi:hypothetical protein
MICGELAILLALLYPSRVNSDPGSKIESFNPLSKMGWYTDY